MPTTRKRNELASGKWKKLRIEILARDGYICSICGGDGADTVDHIVARVHGGDIWDRENLAAAHKSCNSRKGAKKAFFSEGLATPPAFLDSSLPKTTSTKPTSPFQKP
jgi:5-methylcytosine-specific restriction endonuclease McrA